MELSTINIGEIVAQDFRAAAIFKKYGIDFCCKGNRTVEDACAPKGVDPNAIYNEIDRLPGKSEEIDFTSWPLDLLADYVEKKHHRYVEEKIPFLLGFLDKLRKVHGPQHPELLEINDLFNQTAENLMEHMQKEENILFPFIRQMVKSKSRGEAFNPPPFGTVENPVSMMKHEHEEEGDRFRKIAELSDNYTPPADACNTYKVTYAMLEEFENDLHLHIHLENNILFPGAINMESELK